MTSSVPRNVIETVGGWAALSRRCCHRFSCWEMRTMLLLFCENRAQVSLVRVRLDLFHLSSTVHFGRTVELHFWGRFAKTPAVSLCLSANIYHRRCVVIFGWWRRRDAKLKRSLSPSRSDFATWLALFVLIELRSVLFIDMYRSFGIYAAATFSYFIANSRMMTITVTVVVNTVIRRCPLGSPLSFFSYVTISRYIFRLLSIILFIDFTTLSLSYGAHE
jgi:hypothetical protein